MGIENPIRKRERRKTDIPPLRRGLPAPAEPTVTPAPAPPEPART